MPESTLYLQPAFSYMQRLWLIILHPGGAWGPCADIW